MRGVVRVIVAATITVAGLSSGPTVAPVVAGNGEFRFTQPVDGQLTLAGTVDVRVQLPAGVAVENISAMIDGVLVPSGISLDQDAIVGEITNVAVGMHTLRVEATPQVGDPAPLQAEVTFEAIALQNPDECEVLNSADCLLPYPSSRFLEAADTPTGFRINFPAAGMPLQFDTPLSPEPYRVLDGFSPTVQILMHFPGGVDLVQSNASRLLEETRSIGERSLDADSPTVLIDAESGEHILHFVELDARTQDPARQVVFLRPGRSLLPGHRYIVAVRDLRHPDGSAVEAEPPFAALRDNRPTDIAGIEMRRTAFTDIFARLQQAGVARETLILAFDFVVQSDEGLTGEMLAMRDYSFQWLAAAVGAGESTFTVDRVNENNCTPGTFEWRRVEGTFRVPLFLTTDPVLDPTSRAAMSRDTNGNPAQNGFTNPEFTIAIPCSVLETIGDCNRDFRVTIDELVRGVGIGLGQQPVTVCAAFDGNEDGSVLVNELVLGVDASLNGGGSPKSAAVLGHGLFMTGRSFVPLVSAALGPLLQLQGQEPIELIGGGTDWRALSGQDIAFVGNIIADLNQIAALPDRLRQGQLNALMLGRMMKSAAFNSHPAFQTPTGRGVFAGPEAEMYYYGISLGGIMGLMHAALSPDVTALAIDEGSINFSLLLQRSTQAAPFETVFVTSGIDDPMQTALLLSMTHELWVRGESAGYATHITSNPLPGTPAKKILMTVAWLDQQVTNQGSEITARTLGIPNLVPGSIVSNLPQIEDQAGPVPSAYIVYDTGTFELSRPGPFIPPLANLIPEQNRCDPHGERRPTIPVSLRQVARFFQPGGLIENFCNDACDAAEMLELPLGGRCDPFG